ncbi:MAG: hypothetical protein PHW76_03250 [Alphaproteobacteria bacterium]|nr:hypothetical protein [Alphaproteobacteria bacterium]
MESFGLVLYIAIAVAFFYIGVFTAKEEPGERALALMTALFWPISAIVVILHARRWRVSNSAYFQERGL